MPKQKAEVFGIQVEDVEDIDSQQLPCLARKNAPRSIATRDPSRFYVIATFDRKQNDHYHPEFPQGFDSEFFLDKIAPLYLMSVPTERLVFSAIGFKARV